MILRNIGSDLRRSPALLLGLIIAASCTLLLIADSSEWTGRWVAMTVWLRGELAWVVAISAGFATWAAGRDRRRRLAEFVAATPRPRWQVAARSCLALSLCAIAGYLLAFAVGAVLVHRVATYGNTHWVPILAVGALSAVPACTFGYAVGQRVSWILTAPATIAVVATLFTLPKRDTGRVALLDTMATDSWGAAGYLQWRGHLGQILALAGFAAGFLIAGSCRRWWIGAGPIALGVVAALLLFGAHPSRLWRPDQTARQTVCRTGTPEFCTTREFGYALDAVAPRLQEMLAPLAGVPGLPGKLVDPGVGIRTDVPTAYFIDQRFDHLGRLTDTQYMRDAFLWNLHYRCRKQDQADLVFTAWLSGDLNNVDDSTRKSVLRLRQLPEDRQRRLIREFFTARTQCDPHAGGLRP
jgi:hypothetical protein